MPAVWLVQSSHIVAPVTVRELLQLGILAIQDNIDPLALLDPSERAQEGQGQMSPHVSTLPD